MPTAEATTGEEKATKDDLSAQLAATRRDVEILAAMVRGRATASMHEVRDAAISRADELSAEAREMIGNAKTGAQANAQRMAEEACAQVRQNPLAAIAIAFGLGWLIGKSGRR